MKFDIYLGIMCLLVLSCKESLRREETMDIHPAFGEFVDTNEITTELELCTICDSIYNLFPKDSLAFEMLYGYPNGSRNNDAQKDFINYVDCLGKCYDLNKLLDISVLGSSIKVDVDGSNFLRHYLAEYFMNNKDKALVLYTNIDCFTFVNHLKFLYSGVESINYANKLCNYLLTYDFVEACKTVSVRPTPSCLNRNELGALRA